MLTICILVIIRQMVGIIDECNSVNITISPTLFINDLMHYTIADDILNYGEQNFIIELNSCSNTDDNNYVLRFSFYRSIIDSSLYLSHDMISFLTQIQQKLQRNEFNKFIKYYVSPLIEKLLTSDKLKYDRRAHIAPFQSKLNEIKDNRKAISNLPMIYDVDEDFGKASIRIDNLFIQKFTESIILEIEIHQQQVGDLADRTMSDLDILYVAYGFIHDQHIMKKNSNVFQIDDQVGNQCFGCLRNTNKLTILVQVW